MHLLLNVETCQRPLTPWFNEASYDILSHSERRETLTVSTQIQLNTNSLWSIYKNKMLSGRWSNETKCGNCS